MELLKERWTFKKRNGCFRQFSQRNVRQNYIDTPKKIEPNSTIFFGPFFMKTEWAFRFLTTEKIVNIHKISKKTWWKSIFSFPGVEKQPNEIRSFRWLVMFFSGPISCNQRIKNHSSFLRFLCGAKRPKNTEFPDFLHHFQLNHRPEKTPKNLLTSHNVYLTTNSLSTSYSNQPRYLDAFKVVIL